MFGIKLKIHLVYVCVPGSMGGARVYVCVPGSMGECTGVCVCTRECRGAEVGVQGSSSGGVSVCISKSLVNRGMSSHGNSSSYAAHHRNRRSSG